MPKKKGHGPDLSDWEVILRDGAPHKVRASSAAVAGGWFYLKDAYGGTLLAAPEGNVVSVRRLESAPQADGGQQ